MLTMVVLHHICDIPSSSMIVTVVEFGPISTAIESCTFTTTLNSSLSSTIRSPIMVMFWQPEVAPNAMVRS